VARRFFAFTLTFDMPARIVAAFSNEVPAIVARLEGESTAAVAARIDPTADGTETVRRM
jgi:hypothetical protein